MPPSTQGSQASQASQASSSSSPLTAVPATAVNPPTLNLHEIAERLQGYDPQALSAQHVNAFLAQLVQPVQEQEMTTK